MKKDIKSVFSSKESVDTIYLFVLQGANYIIPLITTPYLMKVLGASSYGLLGFSFSLILYFTLFVDFGFNLSATKRISSQPNNADKVFTSVLISKTILLLISLLVAPFFININSISVYKYAILCFLPLLIGNTYSFLWYFQGIGKVRIFSIMNALSKVIVLPLTFVFVHKPNDVYIAILVQSCVYLVTSIISNYYLFRYKLVHIKKIGFVDIKEEFSESYPLFLSSAATSLYTQLFTIILGFISTTSVVGCYSACERIIRTLYLSFYSPISQAFFSKLSKLASVDIIEADHLFKKLRKLIWIIMVILILLIWESADIISDFMGKDDYESMSTILRLMSFALIAIATGALYGQMGLVAMGDKISKNDFTKVYIYMAPISLGVMYVLSKQFGIYGTATTLLLTECGVCLLMCYYHLKNYKRLIQK